LEEEGEGTFVSDHYGLMCEFNVDGGMVTSRTGEAGDEDWSIV
jgi:hypothetical protein